MLISKRSKTPTAGYFGRSRIGVLRDLRSIVVASQLRDTNDTDFTVFPLRVPMFTTVCHGVKVPLTVRVLREHEVNWFNGTHCMDGVRFPETHLSLHGVQVLVAGRDRTATC